MPALPLPSQDELRQLLIYDPETGGLWWRRWGPGSTARGRRCGLDQVQIGAHRVATARVIWKMETGQEPPMVDHWDGCDRNHRWNNLRAATASLNGANTVQRSSATGHRGVYPNNRAGTVPTYRATIRVRGRMIELGTYKTLEEAVARRLAAEEEYQGEFAASHRPVGGLTTPD